jgi:23S rRNA (guanosine2251-2'-O)-methyltransferase
VLFIAKGRHFRADDVRTEAGKRGIPVKTVESSFFDRFGKGHQGVAARVPPRKYLLLSELLELPVIKKEIPFFFILDCLEDPRNFGAILRVADAAGVHGVVVQSHRSVTLETDVAKASAGAVEYVPAAMVPNIKHAIREMRDKGIWIIGADGQAQNVSSGRQTSPTLLALVLGSEGKGLRGRLLGSYVIYL